MKHAQIAFETVADLGSFHEVDESAPFLPLRLCLPLPRESCIRPVGLVKRLRKHIWHRVANVNEREKNSCPFALRPFQVCIVFTWTRTQTEPQENEQTRDKNSERTSVHVLSFVHNVHRLRIDPANCLMLSANHAAE